VPDPRLPEALGDAGTVVAVTYRVLSAARRELGGGGEESWQGGGPVSQPGGRTQLLAVEVVSKPLDLEGLLRLIARTAGVAPGVGAS